jgi:hypothetical protein
MQKVIACVLLLAIAALAQQSNFLPTTINSGAVTIGTLPPTTTANAFNIDLYRVFVPENTSSINFMFSNTDTSSCSYVHLFVRTGGLPCSYHTYSESNNYICAAVYDPQNGVGSSPVNSLSYPGDDDDLYAFAVDQYQYIGIGRYSSSDNTDTCSYSVTVNVNATCPVGSIVVYASSSSQYCQAYVPVTFGAGPQFINSTSIFKATVPQGTGQITLVLNSTSSSANFYGANYAYALSGNTVCNNPSGTSQGNYYIYNVVCYTPRAGSFFFTVSDSSDFNGTVSFNALVCPDGMGGYNCSFPSTPLNFSALATGITLNIPYASTGSFYTTYYYYFDVQGNNNITGQTVTVTGTSSLGSGYGYMRRDGYPTDTSSSGYEASVEYDSYPSSFPLTQFEYQVAGRIYFGFDCYSTGGCTILVAAQAPATPTTGLTVTTAAVTSAVGLTTNAITSAAITSARGLTTSAITSGGITSRGLTTNAVTSSRGLTTAAQDSASSSVLPVFATVCFLVLSLLF